MPQVVHMQHPRMADLALCRETKGALTRIPTDVTCANCKVVGFVNRKPLGKDN